MINTIDVQNRRRADDFRTTTSLVTKVVWFPCCVLKGCTSDLGHAEKGILC